jgi:hypothetical protein
MLVARTDLKAERAISFARRVEGMDRMNDMIETAWRHDHSRKVEAARQRRAAAQLT